MNYKSISDFESLQISGGSNKRVVPGAINGSRVYIKKSAPFKSHLGHTLQGVIYRLTKNSIWAPSILKSNENDISFQVARLKELADHGFRVPRVLYVGENFFVMSDLGENLMSYLKKHPDKVDQCLDSALRELARLHHHGFVHGGAQIRNYVIKGGLVSLIDFEERADPQHTKHLQIRDVLLFLLSLEKCGLDPDVKKLCLIYQEHGGRDIYTFLSDFFRKYRWMNFLNLPVFKFIRMNDVRALLRLMARFERLEND